MSEFHLPVMPTEPMMRAYDRERATKVNLDRLAVVVHAEDALHLTPSA